MAEVRALDTADRNQLAEFSKQVRALLATGFTGKVILHCRAGALRRVECTDQIEWPPKSNGTSAPGLDKRASMG